jgi:ribosomal protein S18 acetylase RimI-like enzyme
VPAGGVRVRRVRADDVAALDAIMRAAYGVELPYHERIASYLRQRGALPLVAEHGGRVAGAVFGNDFGTSAYVSMMGVDPALHGRGIGAALMAELLAWCEQRGFHDVRLDATPAGARLYERLGFLDFGETIGFARERVAELRAAAGVAAAQPADFTTIARLDGAAFGADRSPMLEPLLAAHEAFVAPDERGYVVVQRTSAGATLGPWIALDPATARDLLDAALAAAGARAPALYVPSTNQAALDVAAAAGFVVRRTLRHMIRGAGATPSEAMFGRANLGQG